MKRNYKYEKEMLHWLDGGDIEERCFDGEWEPFDGDWVDDGDWEYRISKPAEKPKEERWLYVNKRHDSHLWIAEEETEYTIGKIRMEDV
jgi:hypothetical protein